MLVCGINIADDKGLTDFELVEYAKELKIENFRGVFMRDNLPLKQYNKECGIVNFNKSSQSGSHWVFILKMDINVCILIVLGKLHQLKYRII